MQSIHIHAICNFVTMELLRPFVNILLFIAYLLFFGKNSLEKYYKQDVIINRNLETPLNISPPGTNLNVLFLLSIYLLLHI